MIHRGATGGLMDKAERERYDIARDALTKKPNTDPRKSAQNCGCDEGAGWTCEGCKIKAQGSRIQKTADGGEILVVRAAKEGLQSEIERDNAKYRAATTISKDAQTDIGFAGYVPRHDIGEGPTTAPSNGGSRLFGDDAQARKACPLFTGVLMYFPDALAEVARVSQKGNDQHNPGEPLHWARGKSTDQLDTATRHMMDHGVGDVRDSDGGYHLAKAAWRILAELQLTMERERR